MANVLSTTFLATAIVFTLAGCSQTYTTPAGTTTVTGDQIVSKDPTGQMTVKAGGSTAYPSTMPVQQYPNSTVIMTTDDKSDKAGTTKLSAMLNSKDSIDKIVAFYKAQLASAGYNIENEQSGGSMANLYAKKGEQQINVSVIGGSSDGGNTISIGLL